MRQNDSAKEVRYEDLTNVYKIPDEDGNVDDTLIAKFLPKVRLRAIINSAIAERSGAVTGRSLDYDAGSMLTKR